MKKRPYEKLIVWQEAYALCLWIYRLTKSYPSDERFGLVSQMRRSAYSSPMNIAEGNTKRSYKDRLRFFEMAEASLEELHCQCRLSFDLSYINEKELKSANNQISKVGYLLHRIQKSLCT